VLNFILLRMLGN